MNSQKNIFQNDNSINFAKFFNSSRNKNIKSKNSYVGRNELNKKSIFNPSSMSPESSSIQQKKKKKNSYSYLNNIILNKNQTIILKNKPDKKTNKTILKERILFNNNYSNRNSSIHMNKNYSTKSHKNNHSDSTKKIKKADLKNISRYKNIKGSYINNFFTILHKAQKLNNKFH